MGTEEWGTCAHLCSVNELFTLWATGAPSIGDPPGKHADQPHPWDGGEAGVGVAFPPNLSPMVEGCLGALSPHTSAALLAPKRAPPPPDTAWGQTRWLRQELPARRGAAAAVPNES